MWSAIWSSICGVAHITTVCPQLSPGARDRQSLESRYLAVGCSMHSYYLKAASPVICYGYGPKQPSELDSRSHHPEFKWPVVEATAGCDLWEVHFQHPATEAGVVLKWLFKAQEFQAIVYNNTSVHFHLHPWCQFLPNEGSCWKSYHWLLPKEHQPSNPLACSKTAFLETREQVCIC